MRFWDLICLRRRFARTAVELSLLAALVLWPVIGSAREQAPFKEVEIEPPFYDFLMSEPAFMEEGGVRLFELEGDRRALVGIGKAVQAVDTPEARVAAVMKS